MNHQPIEPQRWTQIQDIFHAALEKPAGSRGAFLDAACGDDDQLRNEVQSLLSALGEDAPLGTLETASADSAPFPTHPPTLDEHLDRLKTGLEDQYVILEPLGRGGMAVVYLAEDVKHKRKVAIKVLRPDLAVSLAAERFLREIEIAARLHHPHILPVYDSGALDGQLYYVMPFVEGENLAQRLERLGALSPREALQMGVEVASALEYAHQQGFVHRDVKPANIMLSEAGGHAMVADFGIARAVSVAGGDELTAAGWAIGTPGYMSPEQAGGHPVTGATDIFSLGMVIYEALTGRRWPGFRASYLRAWAGLPKPMVRILRRALARRPEDRWPDAGAFREALWEVQIHPGSFMVWRLVVVSVVVLLVAFLVAIVGMLLR